MQRPPRNKATRRASGGNVDASSTSKIATVIAATLDWRDQIIARVRALIQQAAPDAIEEIKCRKPSNQMCGIPVWSRSGILCTGETYKNYVKLTFAKGASLPDPAGLFNASLEGNTRRAIDIHENDKLNEKAFKALIRAAVTLNTSKQAKSRRK
jgi:hypothetical protein